jgi:hypothetical protein
LTRRTYLHLVVGHACASDKSEFSKSVVWVTELLTILLSFSLAYAELYLSMSAIVRRFDLELFQTDFSDVESVCDCVFPMPKADSKGVRVLVQ